MKVNSIMTFLETMCEYNTIMINQVFTAEDGQNLTVRCLPGTTTFEISNTHTQEVIQSDSIEKTADLIAAFLAPYDLSINS